MSTAEVKILTLRGAELASAEAFYRSLERGPTVAHAVGRGEHRPRLEQQFFTLEQLKRVPVQDNGEALVDLTVHGHAH